MNRLIAVAVAALAVPSPAAAAPLNPLPFEQRSSVATCLRAPGAAGDIALYGRGGVDLRAAGDAGAAPAAALRIRRLGECAAVATTAGGAGLIAGAVRGDPPEIRAALRDPGGTFGAPARLGAGALFGSSVSAAVSPAGHAVVAWAQVRGTPHPRRPARFRIVAARRAPGGSFGRVEPLTGWRRGPSVMTAEVQAGIDAAGVATVVWARPLPGQDFNEHRDVGVATAAPGAPFTAHTLVARVDDLTRTALAVAPDGWALLAHDGSRGVRAYERPPGTPRFTEVLASDAPFGVDPAVAVRDGGGALVAWRTDHASAAGAQAAVRAAPGAFGRAQTLARDAGSLSSVGFVTLTGSGGPPHDPEAGALRAALAPDGRALLAWPAERPVVSSVVSPRLAAGSLEGAFAAPLELGSPVRDAAGVAPLFLPDGRAALAWTDNAGRHEASLPSGPGRLQLAIESAAPLPEQPAPRVTLRARRTQRLYASRPARVTATCSRTCDLRATLTAARSSAVSLARTLRAGQPADLRFAWLERAGSVRVVARATAPGGSAVRRAAVRVRVIERPPLPVPATLGVRARRRGRAIVVTWRTAAPARRTSYVVEGRRRRNGDFDFDDPGTVRVVDGRGRTTFAARLRPKRPTRVRWVAVSAYSPDGPRREPVIVEVR